MNVQCPQARDSRPAHRPLRVVVVGNSGSGKTTWGRALAAHHQIPFVEMDALHWGPNWLPVPAAQFMASVEQATQGPSWVADGNYSAVRELLWGRATDIVWLDYSRWRVLRQLGWRTLTRLLTREVLWAGNREQWHMTLLSRESILLWSWHGVRRYRKRYAELQNSARYPHLQWHVLQHPHQAQRLLQAGLNPASGTD